jgi:replication factor A1
MIKIAQMVPGMRRINLIGKIIELAPIREYNKNGRSGKIGSFVLADDTSNVRTVLWDENHIDLIGKGSIKMDVIVEIGNASIRNGELHLGSFSEIKVSKKKIDNVVTEKPVFVKKVKDFNIGDNVASRAFIVNIFEPKFFEVCPECRRKAINGNCNDHGQIKPEKRSLLSLVIDDGSDNIRCTIFHDELEKIISMKELENLELFVVKRKELLGKEMIVKGQVRKNQMFDSNDFIINEMEDIKLDELITELEK